MFQHIITSNISNVSPIVGPGMFVITLIVLTLSLLLVYFWIDFFYVLFYTTMGLSKSSFFDTLTIAIMFTLILIFVVIIADVYVDWDGWNDNDAQIKEENDKIEGLYTRLDELLLVLKNRI